jgi:hypothetical protein
MTEQFEAMWPRVIERFFAVFLAGTLGGVRLWG